MEKKKFIGIFLYVLLAGVLGLFFFLGFGALSKKSLLMVEKSTFSRPVNSQYGRFQGEVMLPAKGYWQIADTKSAGNITEMYLVPTAPISDEQMGGRLAAIKEEEQIRRGQYFLQQLHWACTGYAREHDNKGPSSLRDLNDKKYTYLIKNLSGSPYDKIAGQKLAGPFIFLVPGVTFRFEGKTGYVQARNKDILAWELVPYVDDGKHWVLYTDGSSERQPIDPGLMKKYKQVIRPVIVKKSEAEKKDPTKRSYSLAAVCKEKPGGPLVVTLEDAYSGETIDVRWDMHKAREAEEAKAVDLKAMRTAAWLPYAMFSHSPILTVWLSSFAKESAREFLRGRQRQRETLSTFDILGGRAAVRETLQLQILDAGDIGGKKYTTPVESIAGVQIKSHPFGEMLKKSGPKGGKLALADLVPHDRFFLYMANPRDILAFLDRGCNFLHHVGTSFTGNGVDYGLDKKYPARLGFNRQVLSSFIKSGTISECALVFPDLFFIDGTDITVISRLTNPGMVTSLLKLTGIKELPQKRIVPHRLKNGETAYWALCEDLLTVSTNENELEKVLQLKNEGSKGSLGQSDEFQYMLSQLPLKESTWSYIYFSDPFIRRLVSPAVKIGQLRRIRARAHMEYLTACALLAKLDGIKFPWSIENLVEYNYIPGRYLDSDYYFDQNHILYSKTFGRLSNMKTLARVPVDRVSSQEESAYKRYVEAYSDYWRQYFDPIALRLDEAADGYLEAEVFILPLVNNSIYNGLKGILKGNGDSTGLKVPQLSSDPVILLSLNLGEHAWQGIVKDGYKMLSRYIPIHPAIFEDFGPGLHLAVHDADPVIALGSGDLLGIFGSEVGSQAMGIGGMFSLPVILSLLTRPCTLIIETQNPERTLSFLKRAVPAFRTGRQWSDLSVRVHQVEDRDQWVFSFSVAGIIKLRFGVELHQEFLLIRNIPWSHDEKITAVDTAVLKSVSLKTFPEACNLQLPGLFAADQDRGLFVAFQGLGHLYPLVLSGYAGVEEAAQKHADLFGFTPRHPGNGQFLWDNFHLKSSTYGFIFNQKQPAYKKGDTNFGLLEGFEYLGVSMQFEDTGLRTKFRWKITR
jgi:hypothetical protein